MFTFIKTLFAKFFGKEQPKVVEPVTETVVGPTSAPVTETVVGPTETVVGPTETVVGPTSAPVIAPKRRRKPKATQVAPANPKPVRAKKAKQAK